MGLVSTPYGDPAAGLTQAKVTETGEDMTPQVTRAFGDSPFYLARSATVVDCPTVLH